MCWAGRGGGGVADEGWDRRCGPVARITFETGGAAPVPCLNTIQSVDGPRMLAGRRIQYIRGSRDANLSSSTTSAVYLAPHSITPRMDRLRSERFGEPGTEETMSAK